MSLKFRIIAGWFLGAIALFAVALLLNTTFLSQDRNELEDSSDKLQKEESLQDSAKLQQIYYVLEINLNKIDSFSKLYIDTYLPERELICSKQKNNEYSNTKLIHIVTTKIKATYYEMDFMSDIIEAISKTDDYIQDIKSPNTPNSGIDKYRNKDGWNIKIMEAIHYDFKKCDLKQNELANKYNKYNNILKDEIKSSMGKIENFYKKNKLDLNELQRK
ncbi:MAG: hypothetical protein V4591_01570 [Bdellovibrionota bacterium]